jgi:hypothetical protein
MTGAGLQKCFSNVPSLLAHSFFANTGLRDDLSAGKVFPAIRKEEVHFYYGGARLCAYKDGHMYINNRYLGISDQAQSRDMRIPEDRFNVTEYEAIKRTCKEWRPPDAELSIVSELFSVFSIAASGLPADRARLLDIECRFPGAAEAVDAEPETAQDMIDCLFLTQDGTLVFVEVKKADNPAARGSGQGEPAVARQLRRYRRQLGSDDLRKEITGDYASVTDTLSRIMTRPLPAPRSVFKSVPLLIVGPVSPPSPRAKEVWQRDLLASPLSPGSDIIGIDGRNGRMNDALDDFFHALAKNPAEAANQ